MSTELRDLLDQHSQAAPPTLDAARLGQVRRRIARHRRRRAAVTTAAALALIALIAVTLRPGLGADPVPPTITANPTASVNGFPEYRGGARLAASKVAELPERQLMLTFVPRTLDFTVSEWCSTSMWVEIAVNGHQLAGADCEPMPSLAHWENSARLMSDFGVQVGEPAIFTLTPKHVSDYSAGIPGRQKPLPANGTYALAIGERIPFEAYPLPPRPATLTAIDFHSDRPVVARVDSDPGDPLRPMSTTITWTGSTLGLIASQTPGFLAVTVNGVTVITHEAWDYEAQEMTFAMRRDNLALVDGDRVTVTVVPTHITGPWSLVIVDD